MGPKGTKGVWERRSRGLGAFDQNVQGLRVLQNFGEHLSLLQAQKKKLALANAASHLVS